MTRRSVTYALIVVAAALWALLGYWWTILAGGQP
jgi:hypothetical protein